MGFYRNKEEVGNAVVAKKWEMWMAVSMEGGLFLFFV